MFKKQLSFPVSAYVIPMTEEIPCNTCTALCQSTFGDGHIDDDDINDFGKL